MAQVKQIKDPVHGYIPIKEELVDTLIDHRTFQRLRNLKQLSATHLVYPGANHSRFEHSLGVYHLARQAFDGLKEDSEFCSDIDVEETRTTVLAAALLHDIGHPPFSHMGEELLDRPVLKSKLEEEGFVSRLEDADIGTGISREQPLEKENEHELLSCIIILKKFRGELQELGVDPHEVCSHILGLSIKGESEDIWQRKVAADIISSPMDVDRLDYITRDNFMTGAEVAKVDTTRMVNSYETCEGSLVLSDKALSTISNYLEGRIAVYMWINQHHKSVYANALLREMIEELDEKRDGDLITADGVLQDNIDDGYVMEELRKDATDDTDSRVARLYRRFAERDFPRSCWKHRLAYENILGDPAATKFHQLVDTNPESLEEELVEELGVGRDDLWLEVSYVPSYQPSDLRQVHLAYEGSKQSVSEIGLYTERDYMGPTPYIFTSDELAPEVIELIKSEFDE